MALNSTKELLLLLTDDDEDDREIFCETVEELNTEVRVQTLNDGKQLMEYLCDMCNPLPDILFLDINMPHKDGHQSLREIRANPRLAQLCVIMYSTSDYPGDVKKAYKNGRGRLYSKTFEPWKIKGNSTERNRYGLERSLYDP